jgi:hypothetical protein
MCPIHFTRLKEGYVGHFDGIGSINGFFGYGYFCLKHYNNKENTGVKPLATYAVMTIAFLESNEVVDTATGPVVR